MSIKRWGAAVRAAVIAGLIATLGISAQAFAPRPTPPPPDPAFTKTRYPIVLAHGLFGFSSVGGVDYFYGIPSALRAKGATVFTPQVPAANTSEVRGEALLKYLRQLKATHGHQKFNLIGHSHGSHSVRYVAGVAPELVASVLLVGGPNQGSVIPDLLLSGTGAIGITNALTSIVNAIARAAGGVIGGDGLGGPQDSLGALKSLSTAGAADFNRRFPAGMPTTRCGSGAHFVNGVYYYSASGTIKGSMLINLFTFDPADLALTVTQNIFRDDNDGLVSRCSSRWGLVLRDNYDWNHGDEINQVFGSVGFNAQSPVSFYRTHANRLKNMGL
jgi:triacylglycerol lipase